MSTGTTDRDQGGAAPMRCERHMRADAVRNRERILEAATTLMAIHGIDVPIDHIADLAQVGVGTVYRHFPQRSDLVAAVFRHEVDGCADAAPVLAAEHGPGDALARWMQRYAAFIATKRGLATALHSGNPAFDTLPAYFQKRLLPALRTLLEAAAAAGEVRADVSEVHAWAIMGMNVFLGLRYGVWTDDGDSSEVAKAASEMISFGLSRK